MPVSLFPSPRFERCPDWGATNRRVEIKALSSSSLSTVLENVVRIQDGDGVSLGSPRGFGTFDPLGNVGGGGSDDEERPHDQVERHRAIGGFPLRDTRLTRSQPVRQRGLRQSPSFAKFADSSSERQ